MTRVLITGGTGVLGSQLLPRLQAAGYSVRIMSRSPRKAGYDAEIEWATAQLESGAELSAAVKDVDVIIHAASSAVKAAKVDVLGTQRLLNQAHEAGVRHFVYISIVGIDRHPLGYYKQKLATEQVIERGKIPWTILRATQFHDLIEKLFLKPFTMLPLVAFMPKDFQFQPIDESDVAARLVELVAEGPAGHVADIGGPQILTLEQLARPWLKATGKHRLLVNLPFPGKTAASYRKGHNNAPENRYGTLTWQDWLGRKYRPAATEETLPSSGRA